MERPKLTKEVSRALEIVAFIVGVIGITLAIGVVLGYLAMPMGSVVILFATLGAIFISSGILMILRKSMTSKALGIVIASLGAMLLVESLIWLNL